MITVPTCRPLVPISGCPNSRRRYYFEKCGGWSTCREPRIRCFDVFVKPPRMSCPRPLVMSVSAIAGYVGFGKRRRRTDADGPRIESRKTSHWTAMDWHRSGRRFQVAPVAPVTPVNPVGPVHGHGYTSRSSRTSHARKSGRSGCALPVAPVTPVTPVGPVAPVTPVNPVGPVAPVAPVNPVVVHQSRRLTSRSSGTSYARKSGRSGCAATSCTSHAG